MGGMLKFTEHFFWTMLWVVLVLIAAGLTLHFLNARGILPGFVQNLISKTNLASQAGGGA